VPTRYLRCNAIAGRLVAWPGGRVGKRSRAGLPAGLSSIINNPALSRVPVPPQKPNIVDERGKEVLGVAGPYEEGAELKLTCIVSGGE
jgi:hypothetical protein